MKPQNKRVILMTTDSLNNLQKRYINLDRQTQNHDQDLTKRWESAIQELKICLGIYENLLERE